jgi:hypothetical protein
MKSSKYNLKTNVAGSQLSLSATSDKCLPLWLSEFISCVGKSIIRWRDSALVNIWGLRNKEPCENTIL